MTAIQKTQEFRVEGLDTHADTVDTKPAEGSHIFNGDIIGVTLHGQFLKAIKTIYGADAVNNLTYLTRGKTRRSTASEINSGYGSTVQVFLTLLEFGAQGIYITCGFILTHGGEEAAVYTASGTERNMYVYARHKKPTVKSWS
jgi:hypothetical protein